MNINIFTDIKTMLETLDEKEKEAKAIREKSDAEKKEFDRKRRKELAKARKLEKEVKDYRATLDYLMDEQTQKIYHDLTFDDKLDHHSHIQVDDQQNNSPKVDSKGYFWED